MNQYIKGLVSVIIPTYRRSDLLSRAISTTLNQTYKEIELIIVNDNEKNDSYSIKLYETLSHFNDKRLRLIEQERHINGAVARNIGIKAAKGEFIAFQDDDDFWEPQKIERQVRLLSSLDKSWGAVSCLMRIYSHGKLVLSALPYRDGEILLDLLVRRTSLGTGALLIRRTALDDSGYFDECLIRHQDLQLFARLASKYKVKLDRVYLHNRDRSDRQNMPNAETLKEIKNAYFNSIRDVLDMLKPSDLQKVYIMHNFECAYPNYKSGNYKKALYMFIGVFRTPSTVYLAFNRCIRRFIEVHFADFLQKKYEQKEM